MNKQVFEQKLTQQIKHLEREKFPERDLWPGVELALVEEIDEHERDKGLQKFRLLAASILVVGVLGWLSFSTSNRTVNSDDLVASLSEQHFAQKQALLMQFKDQPALTKNWREQLNVLDEAEIAIKSALQNEPNNIALLKLLQNVYQQQISLIERVHSPKWLQI